MTQEAREIQILAQVIADATVAGDLSSKSLAITLHKKGYRLVPELKVLTEEDIDQLEVPPNQLWNYKAYIRSAAQAQLDSIKKQIEEANYG